MEAQIDQLRSMLEPDGYKLDWRLMGSDTIELQVIAGEAACAECLVPKTVFAEIANSLLEGEGVRVGKVIYPEGEGAHAA
jgi:hypothetical protein